MSPNAEVRLEGRVEDLHFSWGFNQVLAGVIQMLEYRLHANNAGGMPLTPALSKVGRQIRATLRDIRYRREYYRYCSRY